VRSFVSIQREIAEVEREYSISLSKRSPRPDLKLRLARLQAERKQAALHGREEMVRQSRLVTDQFPSTSGRRAVPMQSGDVATRNTVVQSWIGGATRSEIKTRATVVERAETARGLRIGQSSAMEVNDLDDELARLRSGHRRQLRNRQYAQASHTLAKIRAVERELEAARASRGRANAMYAGRRPQPDLRRQPIVRPVPPEPQIPRQLDARARVAYIDKRIEARNAQLAYYRKAAIIGGLLTPIGGVAAAAYSAAEIVNIGKVQKIKRQLLSARSQAVGEARNADTRYFAPPVPTSREVEALPAFLAPAPADAEQQLVASVSSEFVKGKEGGSIVASSASESEDKSAPAAATGETRSVPWLWIGLAAAAAAAVVALRRKKKPAGAA
jgi:LPXTG-motif cell wall-anchored protein